MLSYARPSNVQTPIWRFLTRPFLVRDTQPVWLEVEERDEMVGSAQAASPLNNAPPHLLASLLTWFKSVPGALKPSDHIPLFLTWSLTQERKFQEHFWTRWLGQEGFLPSVLMAGKRSQKSFCLWVATMEKVTDWTLLFYQGFEIASSTSSCPPATQGLSCIV